jgi:hypothetical protein
MIIVNSNLMKVCLIQKLYLLLHIFNYILKYYIMKSEKVCQSCSMPLNKKELFGTEKNGSINEEYCSYCYKNGAFTGSDVTMEEMQKFVKNKMIELKIPGSQIDKAVNSIPYLRRWNAVTN